MEIIAAPEQVVTPSSIGWLDNTYIDFIFTMLHAYRVELLAQIQGKFSITSDRFTYNLNRVHDISLTYT